MTVALIIIDAPHFYAGLVLGERAAPIIKYMLNWSLPQVKEYCRKKRWKVIEP